MRVYFLLMACNTATVDKPIAESDQCPAPRFESMGVWNNEDLPVTVTPEGRDPGLGIGDVDGDGDEDILYAWAGNTQLILNEGAGVLTLGPELSINGQSPTFSRAVAMTDLDEDGDLDVLLGHDAPAADEVLWNDGDGLSYQSTLLPDSDITTWSMALGDFNGDGLTDIYNATYAVPFDFDLITQGDVVGMGHAFWMQSEDGWEKVPVPVEADTAVSLQGAVVDADMDGRLDIYMINDFGPYVLPNRLLHNDGTGFSVASDCACELSVYAMGGAVGDSNGDGAPDLLVTDIGTPHLLWNDGTGAFYDVSLTQLPLQAPTPTRMTSWGAIFVDMDMDGDSDTVQAYGSLGPNGSTAIGHIANTDPSWTEEEDQYSTIMVNDGSGTFSLLPDANFPELSRARVVTVADLDQDLRPDLVVAGRKRVQAWHNVGGCETGVVLSLRGAVGNSGAFGAKVEAEVNGHLSTQWLLPGSTGSQSTPKVFVGLGKATKADTIVITWPDGQQSTLNDVPSGQITVVEGA